MEQKRNSLDTQRVAKAVAETITAIGDVDMGGIHLNKPDPAMLDLNALTTDIHVAMHPAAIAYFGAVKKDASRMLNTLKKDYDRWRMRRWAEAKAKLDGGNYKPTREDVEARLVVDNEKAVEDWEKRMDEAQESFDDLDSWYEAFRQKSFAMRDHVAMEEEERFSSSGSMGRREDGGAAPSRDDMNSEKIRRVKDIIRRRRETSGGQ
jgi:hypothetical protein